MICSETALLSRVARAVRRQHLFNPGDTLIVALSGGADSSALLDLLSRLPGYTLHLVAAHLNHSLRGVESDADEEFCRALAARYAIPFESRRIDVKELAAHSRLNLEDAGRQARIRFLDEIRSGYGAAAVALAHHADDQAETVLMRLLRGSGMTGLSGMAPRNERGYVRPLLDISRSEIEQYLGARGLEWREDASNRDTTFLRNRVRHQLLPLLETYNPAVRSCLAATAAVLGGDEALLCELAEQAFAASCLMGEGRIDCRVRQLYALNPALRRRVLRHAFRQLTGTLDGVSQRHIEALCELIDSDRPNTSIALPHGVKAAREYERLSLMVTGGAAVESGFELLITEPGRYQLPDGGYLAVETTSMVSFTSDADSACFDSGRIPFPWLVRTFRPGDRMTPFGMAGRKKVKDIFIDRKIPLSERRRIPLLFCGDDLIWIAGVCASELSRIDTPSAATVQVTWHAQR
jgi:tRNA(Ile)-lysidine synthase